MKALDLNRANARRRTRCDCRGEGKFFQCENFLRREGRTAKIKEREGAKSFLVAGNRKVLHSLKFPKVFFFF